MTNVFWAMTMPASNKRGYMIAYCVERTRRECWDTWAPHPEDRRQFKKYGYKPRKVAVIPLEEARQSDESMPQKRKPAE